MIFYLDLFSYADDLNEPYLFGAGARGGGVRLFGDPEESVSRSFDRMPHSVRVVTVRVLTPSGVRAQLHPITSLHCSRLVNRVFGMIFNSGWRIIPAPVHDYFRLGKFHCKSDCGEKSLKRLLVYILCDH